MKIKYSKRGLTFSFAPTETFQPGVRYRYVVDTKNQEVILLPEQDGKYKLSRKGASNKPLVDLRNQEIKDAIALSSGFEIEICDDRIIVHLLKKDVDIATLSEAELADYIDRSEEVSFEISKEQLMAHDSALTEMLTAAGLFSAQTVSELSYVYDTVSLFSGAGLLDYPFRHDEAFDLKFACDFDKEACETYSKNIGDHILCADMRDLREEQVPECELIIGGPCCQGYSNANRKNISKESAREKRALIDDYIRIVRAKKPLVFVIENVPQFITKEEGRYLARVLDALSKDYHITYSIIKDNEIGGYTTRQRMVLIGNQRTMAPITIPDVELNTRRTAGEALKKVNKNWFNYTDISKASEETKRKMAQVPAGGNFKNIAEMKDLNRHSDVYRRLQADAPAPSIVNWRKINLMPPTGNRILSVSEAAALMGLERDFHFFGSLNAKQQQVGNGVTQSIARFVKDIVKNALYGFTNAMLIPTQ